MRSSERLRRPGRRRLQSGISQRETEGAAVTGYDMRLDHMRRILPLALAAALLSSGCKKSIPDNVAAMVNNRPITYADLDKQFQLQFSGSGERPPNDDQAMSQKLEVLRTLIDNEIMLQRAEKQSLMAVDADVDAKFNELKAP